MGKRDTHEQFIEKFYKKNIHANNIEILGEYQGSNIPIHCKCKLDGYEWFPKPNKLLQNRGCPKCAGNIKSTHEEFLNKFYKRNKNAENIEILGKYVNNYTKIKCKCKLDGYEWSPIAESLLSGTGCPKCANNIKNSHEQFINKMKKINNNIKILGQYKEMNTKIKCKCLVCGYEWEATPHNLLSNHGCLKCYRINNKGENNPNWNPNKTQEERINDRKYLEYKEWRTICFERDNYTCQVTGKRGVELCVHHLYSYNKYRCLRTVMENGITVSKEIHELFHKKYGRGNNTLEQWEKFIKELKGE